jgi:hypothetical protein
MSQTWRVSPFVKPLHLVTAPDGSCGLPDDVAHCHGSETQHVDGIAECVSDGDCQAPGPGRHVHVHPCEQEINFLYSYRCARCR